ncbi:MAG: hypothetical protein EXR27_06730 [Betaproteobacteria bacterium]|nr:hypothetical protein [Betaproteobacteria bacterium]
MLNFFGGGRPDHPMADPKEARRILAELSAQEVKALEELAKWNESVSSVEGFKLSERIELMTSLDEAALPRARKLSRDYFGAQRPSRYQESQMWTQLHEYWRQAGHAWARVLDLVLQGGKGADVKALPQLAARALRAFGQQVKWQHMRYGPVDPAVWGALNKIALVAEERGMADAKVTLSATMPGETCARQEYLKAAMFSASSPDGLLPLQIELAERLIADLATNFAMSKEPARELLFWTDLQRPTSPQRALKAMPETSGLRCFGPGSAVSILDGHMQKIRASGTVPTSINLGGTYEPEVVVEVMKHLTIYWAYEPQERRHPRVAVKSRLTIAHGFQGALDSLGGGGALDFDKKAAETWIAENVSPGGFGAVVQQMKSDWLRVGALLAMQPDGGGDWVVGIVRRVSRVSIQEARVGIETISNSPSVVTFNLGPLAAQVGLLLPATDPGAGTVSIALPPEVYVRGINPEAHIGGRDRFYMQAGESEHADDYELLRFREMLRDG